MKFCPLQFYGPNCSPLIFMNNLTLNWIQKDPVTKILPFFPVSKVSRRGRYLFRWPRIANPPSIIVHLGIPKNGIAYRTLSHCKSTKIRKNMRIQNLALFILSSVIANQHKSQTNMMLQRSQWDGKCANSHPFLLVYFFISRLVWFFHISMIRLHCRVLGQFRLSVPKCSQHRLALAIAMSIHRCPVRERAYFAEISYELQRLIL